MRRRQENFNDRIARLYPELHKGTDSRGNKILSKSITFQVTDACNLACSYCYQHNKGHKVMQLDTAKKLVDMVLSGDSGMKDYISPENSPGLILDFIGGEPTLQIELIDEIIDYFRSEALRLHSPWANRFCADICSNGTTYTDPTVQRILAKHDRHLSFSVSLDGDKALHDSCRKFPDGRGSYDLAEFAVKDWMSKGHFMGSKITLSPDNVMHTFSATKHMLDLGFDEININCVFEPGWTIEHAQILYSELKRVTDYLLDNDLEDVYYAMFEENFFHPMDISDNDNWCGGNGAMLACDPDGNLFPCIRYMDSSLNGHQPALKIGDVDNGVMMRPEEKQIVKRLDCITRTSQSTQECIECPIAEGCAWCSGFCYEVYGTPNHRTTFICPMHKARSLANVYFWNKYYQKHNESKRFVMHCPEEWAVPIIGESEYSMLKNLSEGGDK